MILFFQIVIEVELYYIWALSKVYSSKIYNLDNNHITKLTGSIKSQKRLIFMLPVSYLWNYAGTSEPRWAVAKVFKL